MTTMAITVLKESTRVARQYGGHVTTTLNEGTVVRNVTKRDVGYAFEYATGIRWSLAFTTACPATEVDPELGP